MDFMKVFLSCLENEISILAAEEKVEKMLEIEDLYATGEFVRTGDIPEPAAPVDKPAPSDVTVPEPTQDAPDLQNAGEAAQQPKVVTSERPSPAKVKKEKKGPTKEEIQKVKDMVSKL